MDRRRRYDQLEERARELVRFDRFYVSRARESMRAATAIHEVSALQLQIFHVLLPGPATHAWLCWQLGVDGGYLSRTLRLMQESGHISMTQSRPDHRERDVSLTRHGLGAARDLEDFYVEQARKLLDELPLRRQERLIAAMNDVREILQRDWVANLLERFRDPA